MSVRRLLLALAVFLAAGPAWANGPKPPHIVVFLADDQDSWVAKARPDASAAAIVRRSHTRLAEELYDLKADPWQLRNLAAEPALITPFQALRTDLDRWLKDQGYEGPKTERALPNPRRQREVR